MEQTGGLGNYELTKQAIEFLKEVESYSGLEPAVYTYTNFVQNNLYKGLGLSDYELWVAQSREDSPSTNHIWGYKHVGWQYLDIGNVSGISANTNLDILELNNITNPILIYPGEILKIPTVKNKKSKSVSSKQYIKTYIVQSGDTLSGIAKKFNTTVDKLLKINHILNQNLI